MASAGHRLLPEQPGFQGDFKSSIQELLQQPAVQHVYLPALDLRAWLLTLSDGQTKLHVYEEELTESNFACDCCRIVGWQTHPVSIKNWHFIVPAEEGPYSLSDPTTLCAITEARARGEEGSSRIALPAPDPDASHHHQASSVFESKMHRMHGTVHSNGFGHLMRLNGREGGSKHATGRQLMQLWDDVCEALHVREVSTEDVSNKASGAAALPPAGPAAAAGMELRVLHAAARRATWYGQWRYGFGRGGFNMTPQQASARRLGCLCACALWHAAIDYVHGAALSDVLADFDGIDATVLDILQRYRDPAAAAAAAGGRETLGGLLSRVLGLLSHPDPILPAFEAAGAAERERQRMMAELRLLMQHYHEQQRQLAAQQAQHPLSLDQGPTVAYFGVSQQQQELQRQQQELFALASQPSQPAVAFAAAAAADDEAAADADAAPGALHQERQQQEARQEAEQKQQEQRQGPEAEAAAADALAEPTAQEAGGRGEDEDEEISEADPEGEAAAPSGEPELLSAAAAEEHAAEAADEAAAAAHATAQAAIAVAVRAAQPAAAPPAPHPPPAAAADVEMTPAEEEEAAAAAVVPVAAPKAGAGEAAAAGTGAFLSPPPPPPLPASQAAVVAGEVDTWLADYGSGGSSQGGSGAGGGDGDGGEGPVEGVLRCRRGGGLGEPPLVDADAADAAPAPPDGSAVLRLRGGASGGRKRAAADDDGAGPGGAAAKRPKKEGGGSGGVGAEVVGLPIMVYWKEQKTYYTGTVTEYNKRDGKHTVRYRDGDVEHLDLREERFKWSDKGSVHGPGQPVKPPKELKGKGKGRQEEAAPPAKRGKQKGQEQEQAPGAVAGKKGKAARQAQEAAAAAGKRSRKQASPSESEPEEEEEEEEEQEEGRGAGGAKAMDPARRGLGPALTNVPMRIWVPQEERWKRGHSTSYARKCHSFLFEDGSRAPIDLLHTEFQVLDKEAARKLAAAQAAAGTSRPAAAKQRDGRQEAGKKLAAPAAPLQEPAPARGRKRQQEGDEAGGDDDGAGPSPQPAAAAAAEAAEAAQQQQQLQQVPRRGRRGAPPEEQAERQPPPAAGARRGGGAAAARPAEAAARVADAWQHPTIPPPPKPLAGAALRAYLKSYEEAAGAAADGTPVQPPPQQQQPVDDDDAVAAAVAAAAVAHAVAANTPGGSAAPAARPPVAMPQQPQQQQLLQQQPPPGPFFSVEQLAEAAGRQPSQSSREAVAAELAGGRLALGCGSCRYSTGGCKRCRPRVLTALEAQGLATDRLQLLGACNRCRDYEHGCPACWRMILLAGEPALVAQLLSGAAAPAGAEVQPAAAAATAAAAAEGKPAAEERAAAAAARGKPGRGGAKGKRKQQQEAEAAAAVKEEAAAAAEAHPAAEAGAAAAAAGEVPEAAQVHKKARRQQQQQQQQQASQAAAEAAPDASPAVAAAATPEVPLSEVDGEAATGSGSKKKGPDRAPVDEATKAAVLEQRAQGGILLGCPRCRWRTATGCVDCRQKALVQMRHEGLQEALAALGCEHCEASDTKGCRRCWPTAVAAAQQAQLARPPQPPRQQQQQAYAAAAAPAGKKAAKAAAAAGAAEAIDAATADAASPAAASGAAASSASTRRNKALLAVNREAVAAAHAAGKVALGCGRCRYSMTGGCNNCRSRSAELMRKERPALATKLGCEHCEGSEDGCPHCWKDVLVELGEEAVQSAPQDKVAAAMATPLPENEGPGAAAGAAGQPAASPAAAVAAAAKAAKARQPKGKVARQGGAAAAAAAAAVAAVPGVGAVRFGNRITNSRIRVWWSGDNTFYQGRITSYKQGLHRVVYDEDQHAEKLDLQKHHIQLQLQDHGQWLEFNGGQPVGDAAVQAVQAVYSAPAETPPREQPLGVAVKDLLQKRVRVLCSDMEGQWKEGVVAGFAQGKFAMTFDDGTKGRYYLQQEQWEPLDLELLQQRQHAQRGVHPAGAGRQPASPRLRAARAAAAAALGAYAEVSDGDEEEVEEVLEEEAEEGGEWQAGGAAAAAAARPAPPPVPGAASGAPPPAAPAPRTADQLPDPLPLSPEAEAARKYKFGLHKYVGQRVRVWAAAQQAWKEGDVTSYGQGRHKVQYYDGTRGSFNMLQDSFQLLPHPGSPATAAPLLPPAAPAPAVAAAGGAAAFGPGLPSRRQAGMPPLGPKPPQGGPPILDGDLLPIPRHQLKGEFELPPCTQPFSLEKICHVMRLSLQKLKEHPGQWVPKLYVRQHLHAASIRQAPDVDNGLMDYCGRAMELNVLDGWAVYRLRSPRYNVMAHADTAYFQGYIDPHQRVRAMTMQLEVVQLIAAGRWEEAHGLRSGLLEHIRSSAGAATLLDMGRCVYEDYDAGKLVDCYLNLPEVQEALGVAPGLRFESCSDEVGEALGPDVMKTVKHLVPDLLAAYPMLLYQGRGPGSL
ncbi:hypothetical protein CHLNCDRAFT_138584, partial [Chlorella variabilis]